jgi:hypothetical protein
MVKPLKVPEKRKCRLCGKEFVPYRPHQVYCEPTHYQLDYNKRKDIPGRLREQRKRAKKD